MRWYTAVGAWGDCIVAYGNVRAEMARRGEAGCGIVHYGFDPQIADFLRLQEGVREVRHVRPHSPASYRQLVGLSCSPELDPCVWLPYLLHGTDLNPGEVVPTHVLRLDHPQPVNRWHGPVLPGQARAWAEHFLQSLGLTDFVLLHPFSEQSTPLEGHWPHWEAAIRWLVTESPCPVLLTGECWPLGLRHDRLVNAVGLTPSMTAVFALAERARAVFCTSNGLSLYGVVAQRPTLAACNRHMQEPHVFRRWIECRPVSLVEYTEPLSAFQAKACPLLAS